MRIHSKRKPQSSIRRVGFFIGAQGWICTTTALPAPDLQSGWLTNARLRLVDVAAGAISERFQARGVLRVQLTPVQPDAIATSEVVDGAEPIIVGLYNPAVAHVRSPQAQYNPP